MHSSFRYTAEDFISELQAADLIACFRDVPRVGGYCLACHNYGHSWACPPFDYDMQEYLSGYSTALIIATKISPRRNDIPLSDAQKLILPQRRRHEKRLLDMERIYGGRSFAYAGSCLYCPEETCARRAGQLCRHPELVRPSLEACGFDISLLTTELFGIELKWGKNGLIPEYLTLVSGFFHNEESVQWNG